MKEGYFGSFNVLIKKIFHTIKKKIKRLSLLKAECNLFSMKRNQKERFSSLQDQFAKYYDKIQRYDISAFVSPLWEKYISELEKVFLPKIPFNFLRNRIMRKTMFVDAGGLWLREEVSFLESVLSNEKLKELLEEDYAGVPYLHDHKYLTSHNSIHHLYHLMYFQHKIKKDIETVDAVVEWGGGYGNMAKIIKRIKNDITYTIIDTPLFSCVQWIYLSSVFGENDIELIFDTTIKRQKGKINILPLSFLDINEISCDLFIATWSLSESSKFSQDYVDSLNYFNADHLIIAFQESSQSYPDASRVGEVMKRRGAEIEPIGFLPGNYYIIV